MMDKEQASLMLKLARTAIETEFSGEHIDFPPELEETPKQGVFVTLKNKTAGELRGCIGFPEPTHKLADGIVIAAKAAAFEDPRFEPMDETELKEVKIEISVLSVPKEIHIKTEPEIYDRVKVGRDGLIVKADGRSGLLLPQVPVEFGWDSKRFLEQTCIKAGLPENIWKDDNCKILSFQAEVIEE